MPLLIKTLSFSLACLISLVIVNTPLHYYSPQVIALLALIIISLYLIKKKIYIFALNFLIQVIVFSTNGVHSPFLFLEYFLLFSLAFIETPKLVLIYSLVLCLFISQSLTSFSSLIYLLSFIFIAPLAYFTTQNNQENRTLSYDREETLLWLILELKQRLNKLPPSKDIKKIISHTNELIAELEKND